ncbi:hypothetical protein B0T16DRAFT_78285 [Cercophora newfieldiana]|uniref:Uncharacterized protein n=1 Tax=Cercophora newfieldiana TaxID=92897 RepID=A0AA40CU08_9PEZI|nr:hypothetical protein B0T16DRAFT_78285 [Cercophora newfieldiana]
MQRSPKPCPLARLSWLRVCLVWLSAAEALASAGDDMETSVSRHVLGGASWRGEGNTGLLKVQFSGSFGASARDAIMRGLAQAQWKIPWIVGDGLGKSGDGHGQCQLLY